MKTCAIYSAHSYLLHGLTEFVARCNMHHCGHSGQSENILKYFNEVKNNNLWHENFIARTGGSTRIFGEFVLIAR
ncbi:hypothetical protein BW247_08835 [Acidihalobacter ferrooxydans]|uniref:Uncharacterized protein n=1 Tax=Acidihalobacter ferrooxydans TaxID=1765967 RepID=A0A1P8UHD0_9GAMM|nr:hypothetical protein BW247_08835 [Acidihalobacter ferrooxydans]